MNCKCYVDGHCKHPKHAKYQLPVVASDCESCPMKVVGMPSALKQISNLLTDATAVVMSGFERVTSRAHGVRLAVCNTCPLHNDGRCLACGCSIRIKSEFSSEQCPLGYWDHVDPKLSGTDVVPVPAVTPAELVPTELYANAIVVNDRNKICEGCQHRSGRECNKCSCNLYQVTMIAKSKCPEGKW